MSNKITNLVFDIDDTVYHKDDAKLTEVIYETIMLLSLSGFKIYFATRREAFNLKEVGRYLENGIVSDVICANGLYSINTKSTSSIDEELFKQLESKYSMITVASNGYYTNDLVIFERFATFLGNENQLERSELVNISSINIHSEARSADIEQFDSEAIEVYYDEKYLTYQIGVRNINKYNQVNQVLDGQPFIGFGDNPRDDQCLFKYQGLLLKNDFRHEDPTAVDGYQMVAYLQALLT